MSLSSASAEAALFPAMPIGVIADESYSDPAKLDTHVSERLRLTRRRADREQIYHSSDLKRLRDALLGQSADGASSEDVLHVVLCHIFEEPDARRLAQTLLSTFGELGAVLTARKDILVTPCDGDEECVALLQSIHLLMKMVLREPIADRTILSNLPALFDYLRLSMANETSEVVRILFMNSKNALLKDELHSRGSLSHVPVYPREIVKRIIEVNATGVILVHNHPSGDPAPSNEDIEMTRLLTRVLKDIGVVLHDHVIVGRNRCESMRSLRLI